MFFEGFPLHLSLSAAPNCRIPKEFVDFAPTLNMLLDTPTHTQRPRREKKFDKRDLGCLRIILYKIVLGALGIFDKLQHFDLVNTFFFYFNNLCLGTIKSPFNASKPKVKPLTCSLLKYCPVRFYSQRCVHTHSPVFSYYTV